MSEKVLLSAEVLEFKVDALLASIERYRSAKNGALALARKFAESVQGMEGAVDDVLLPLKERKGQGLVDILNEQTLQFRNSGLYALICEREDAARIVERFHNATENIYEEIQDFSRERGYRRKERSPERHAQAVLALKDYIEASALTLAFTQSPDMPMETVDRFIQTMQSYILGNSDVAILPGTAINVVALGAYRPT